MNIITRAEAKSLGLKRYFTGMACKRGHVAERFVNSARCVECNKVICNEWASKNSDVKSSIDRNYRDKNRDSISAYKKSWYLRNRGHVIEKSLHRSKSDPESARERRRAWKQRNPEYAAFSEGVRRARKLQAIPMWFGEFDELVWQEAAELVRTRELETGISWAADHMIPLAGRKVCGLHMAENCQVIPSVINLEKNNKMILTKRLEWLKY